jgi:hypothetical protein
MMFATKIESQGDVQFLSCVLLDEKPESDLDYGVFDGYLGDQRVRLERPSFIAGLGTTRDGALLGQCTSALLGVRDYRQTGGLEAAGVEIAENRVRLVSADKLGDAPLPCFVSRSPVGPMVTMKAIIKVNISRLVDLPELQAFAVRNPSILRDATALGPLREGMTIPVSIGSGVGNAAVPMRLLERVERDTFRVLVYRLAQTVRLLAGTVLHRKVVKRRSQTSEPAAVFEAQIGTVQSIEGLPQSAEN